MNIQKIHLVRDAIANHTIPNLGFNMEQFYDDNGEPDNSGHDCGTVACICGYANALNPSVNFPEDATDEASAQRYMGLTDYQADALFWVRGECAYTNNQITAEQAVEVLNHLIVTGVVDWSII